MLTLDIVHHASQVFNNLRDSVTDVISRQWRLRVGGDNKLALDIVWLDGGRAFGVSLEHCQLKILTEEEEEKSGKLTRGVVSHDVDRILRGL